MKVFRFCLPALIILLLAASPAFSDLNKGRCQDFCKSDKECKKCSKLPGCGSGYSPMATFKFHKTDYWYACRKNAWGNLSERNKQACLEYCEEHDQCKKCSKHVGCGQGYEKIMSFVGEGKNWHACKKTLHQRLSDRNKAECEEWCGNNELCEKCSTLNECGQGYTSMKHWTGTGKNWHACRKAGAASNRDACLQWCGKNGNCKKCSKKPGCGLGYKPMKMFKGPGKNWFACEKR